MKHRAIAGRILMTMFCGSCLAADPMEERAAQLASALNIATNATAHVASRPVFTGTNTIAAGEFQVKPKRTMDRQLGKPMDVEILDTNGQMVAAGRVIECASFEMARTALLKRLVLNSMGIESLIQKYEVGDCGVGELCIVEKTFNKASGKYSSAPAVIHFLRGCTAVSLYSTAKARDLRVTAKELDAALLELSGPGALLNRN